MMLVETLLPLGSTAVIVFNGSGACGQIYSPTYRLLSAVTSTELNR